MHVRHVCFSCDQAALWIYQSARLSARPSARHTFFGNVRLIVWSWRFQEWLPLTKVLSMQKIMVRDQRSRPHKSNSSLAVSSHGHPSNFNAIGIRAKKIDNLNPILSMITRPVAAIRFASFIFASTFMTYLFTRATKHKLTSYFGNCVGTNCIYTSLYKLSPYSWSIYAKFLYPVFSIKLTEMLSHLNKMYMKGTPDIFWI